MLRSVEGSVECVVYVLADAHEGADGFSMRVRVVAQALAREYGDKLHILAPAARPTWCQPDWKWVDGTSKKTALQNRIYRACILVANLVFSLFNNAAFGRFLLLRASRCSPSKLCLEKLVSETKSGVCVCLFSRIDLAHLISACGGQAFCIIDTNDSIKRLVETYDGYRKLWGKVVIPKTYMVKCAERYEVQYLGIYDGVVAISPLDMVRFHSLGVASGKLWLEECCVFSPPREVQDTEKVNTRYDVGFLGSRHAGSEKAANSLIQQLRDTPYSLAIAGGVSLSPSLTGIGHPRLSILGMVENSYDFWASCRNVVLIAADETGTSVKFQEAILSGARVFANSNAARWSMARQGVHYYQLGEGEVVSRILMTSWEPSRIGELRKLSQIENVAIRWRNYLEKCIAA